jgi:hypothetical protein
MYAPSQYRLQSSTAAISHQRRASSGKPKLVTPKDLRDDAGSSEYSATGLLQRSGVQGSGIDIPLGQSAHDDIVDRLSKKSELFAERWHSPVFSPNADETFLAGEGNRVRVERMYDTERGFALHLFNFSST